MRTFASPSRPGVPSGHQTFLVPGMTCEHCRVAVSAEVLSVAGVTAVDVDLETKLVEVSGRDVDPAAVIAAIDEAGYDAARS